MLCMTMKRGDYLMIGDNVRLIYEQAKDCADVVFAVQAPRDVLVLRGEVYEQGIAKQAKAEGDTEALRQLARYKERRKRELAQRRAERKAEGAIGTVDLMGTMGTTSERGGRFGTAGAALC